MKKLALLAAVALFALALPAAAAETPPAVTAPAEPVTSLAPPAGAPVTPIDLGIIQPIQFCSSVNGTTCPARSGPRSCTDVCGNQLSCDCRFYSGAWRWRCDQEC